jgi:Flp pilus assembly pilin Flp
MRLGFFRLIFKLQRLVAIEDGQDLMEYALLAALIASGAVAIVGQLTPVFVAAYNHIAQMITDL